MIATKQWINEIERAVFPADSVKGRSDAFVIDFFAKATMMNEIMSHEYSNYATRVVKSAEGMWSDLKIKSFLVSGYPASQLEPAFKDEYIREIREVAVGLYPYKRGREINACATLAPDGKAKVVFFSEWLFAFLWDLYQSAELEPPSAAAHKGELKKRFLSGRYQNIDLDMLHVNKQRGNVGRFKMLWGLMLIWAHELGHLFLGCGTMDKTLYVIMLNNHRYRHRSE